MTVDPASAEARRRRLIGFPPRRPSAASASPRTAYHRSVAVDALRGAAVVGMVVYHSAWDLHAFGVLATDPSAVPAWLWFGRSIAALFLGLSGFGLSLATVQGASSGAMLRRLGLLATAAFLVSLASAWLAPRAPIVFGILHCIVATNALALLLRRWNTVALLALSAAALTLPSIWSGLPGSAAWAWIGLSATEPAALDFRPFLPWFGLVVIGMVIGRRLAAPILGSKSHPGFGTAVLAGCGRRSLAIYLLHQPVLIGLLFLLLGHGPQIEAGSLPGDPAQFLQQCSVTCIDEGGEATLCRSTCHCVLTSMASQGFVAPGEAPSAAPATGLGKNLPGAVARCWRARGAPP